MPRVSQLFLLDPFPRTSEMIIDNAAWAELESHGTVISHFGSRMPDKTVNKYLSDVTFVIGQTDLPKHRLDAAPGLKAVINVKGNWEQNIDYEECRARGIWVLSAAPAMAPAVAEACLGFAIDLGRGITRADRSFRAGKEAYGIAGSNDAYSLYGAEVGLIGYGNLGRALRPLLAPFGCKVAVYDPWLPPGYLRAQACHAAGLDTVLSESRFLFILAGATTDNEGFLDRKRLSRIGEDASVILASRAEVVAFDAFVELAEAGHFRALVDVFPEEPVPPEHPVRHSQRIILSSHRAGATWRSYGLIRDMMMEDIRQILNGHPPVRLQRAEPHQAARMRSR